MNANGTPLVHSEVDAALTQALDEYLVAIETSPAPTQEEFLARYPELADDLRTCLASLAFLRRAANHTTPAAPAEPELVLGDYRVVRELGRGGMGIVYEAEQVSLNRRVAVKVLSLAATLDPRHLQRFQNEARAAACLLHPNIVPVYAVGCDRGVHYYAMQLIEGPTLAQVVAHRRRDAGLEARDDAGSLTIPDISDRDYFRTVVRLIVQAAEALDHAHAEDVVHRDVKPANLMVDGRGNLWVADFGLARLGVDNGLTATSDLLGTLRYMSPEQALGSRGVVDHRSDVYSLGATLYELLLLRPPFPGSDRAELLRQIAEEEPRAPRRVDRRVPVELETIVLKAMAKLPADRYPTARELADDLRRFLAGEPIRAKPGGSLERAWKWARRYPTQAALLGVIVLGLVIGLIGSILYGRSLSDALTVSDRLRNEALDREAKLREHLYETDLRFAQSAWSNADPAQALKFLNNHLPQDGRSDLRAFEWYHLHRLCQARPRTLEGRLPGLLRIAVSPDGRWLAAGNKTGTIQVWDLVAGKPLPALRAGVKEINGVQFSPDGTTLATAGQIPVISLWNVSDWSVKQGLVGHASTIRFVAWSPDGKHLASASTDDTVKVWDVEAGKVRWSLTGHTDDVLSVAWSPDGRVLASCGRDRTIKLWGPEDGAELATLRGPEGQPLRAVAFSHDSRALLALGYDKNLAVWDVARRVELARFPFSMVASSITRVPHSDLMLTSLDNHPALWDVGPSPSGPYAARLVRGHHLAGADIEDVVAAPDGQSVIAARADGQIDVCPMADARGCRMDRHSLAVSAVTPDAHHVLGSDAGGAVWVCDRTNAAKRERLLTAGTPLQAAAFSRDGRLLAMARADEVALWDWPARRVLRRWSMPERSVQELLFDPAGRWLAAARKGHQAKMWDASSGEELPTPAAPEVGRPLAFAAGGEVVGTPPWPEVRLGRWEAATGRSLPPLPVPAMASSLAVVDGGRTLVSGTYHSISFWDLESGKETARQFAHQGEIVSLAVSPDGRTLATLGVDGLVKLWRVASRNELFTLGTFRLPLRSLMFTPDGKRLIGLGPIRDGTTDVYCWEN